MSVYLKSTSSVESPLCITDYYSIMMQLVTVMKRRRGLETTVSQRLGELYTSLDL